MATLSPAKLEAMKNKQRFIDVFPDVVEELLDTLRVENMPEEAVEWYKRVRSFRKQNFAWLILFSHLKSLEYNVPGGTFPISE